MRMFLIPLLKYLDHHSTTSVQHQGWAGVKNGELMKLIDARFDVFVLGDKNLRYQQNLSNRKIAIVELFTIRWPFLKPFYSEDCQSGGYGGSWKLIRQQAALTRRCSQPLSAALLEVARTIYRQLI